MVDRPPNKRGVKLAAYKLLLGNEVLSTQEEFDQSCQKPEFETALRLAVMARDPRPMILTSAELKAWLWLADIGVDPGRLVSNLFKLARLTLSADTQTHLGVHLATYVAAAPDRAAFLNHAFDPLYRATGFSFTSLVKRRRNFRLRKKEDPNVLSRVGCSARVRVSLWRMAQNSGVLAEGRRLQCGGFLQI